MADSDKPILDASGVEALLAAAEDSDHELVRQLRGVAAGKFEGATQPPQEPQMSDADMQELAGYRRAKLIDDAGIGNTSTEEKLFREAMSLRPDLSPEMIQAEAAKYGLTGTSEPEPNPAGQDEMAAHQAMVDLQGEAPAAPPDLADQFANAESPEALDKLLQANGFTVSGNQAIDLLR